MEAIQKYFDNANNRYTLFIKIYTNIVKKSTGN